MLTVVLVEPGSEENHEIQLPHNLTIPSSRNFTNIIVGFSLSPDDNPFSSIIIFTHLHWVASQFNQFQNWVVTVLV